MISNKKYFLILLIFNMFLNSSWSQEADTSEQIESLNYHQLRSGLKNSQIKFEREKKGRVAFLGGSITYNSGWRDSITAFLVKRFPETEFDFVAAGIPSMGTTPAAFRLQRDVLSKGEIDLLFEEAAVNDASNGRSPEEQIRGMEGIVRHLRKVNPYTDIVIMHFVDPDKIEAYNKGKEPEVIRNHNKVASHYNIPVLNLAQEVTDRIANKEFSWEEDFKDLHPSPFGQGVYSRSMIHFLNAAYDGAMNSDAKMIPHQMPDRLDQLTYDKGYLIEAKEAEYCRNWKLDSQWKPKDDKSTRENYVNVPMLISESPGSRLKFKFNGSAVGIAVAAGPDAGYIKYRIDKGEWIELNLFTDWSSWLHLPWFYTLANGLSNQNHLLELRVANRKDERSTGKACRIRYFYVNGN